MWLLLLIGLVWAAEQWMPELFQSADPGRSGGSGAVTANADFSARVARVSDGDTLHLVGPDGQNIKARLYGIDAPELLQAHGEKSREALRQWVRGKIVRVEEVDTDDYGRKVVTLWLDSRDINLALVRDGHAWWYRYHARDRHDLEQAEAEARAARRGLWRAAHQEAPWDWRRRH